MTRAWREDLSGRVFGRLSVVSEAERSESGLRHWICVCQCGNKATISHRSLKSGNSRSCGCLRKETTSGRLTTHGQSCRGEKTRIYKIWSGMIARCSIESATGYQNYGGRGIRVCDRWNDFQRFYEDMGEPPSPKHSIDRVDVNGDYSKENCRWSTVECQASNKRNNRYIEHGGKRMTVTAWAKSLGIALATLLEALEKHPIDYALRDRGEG